MFRNETLSVTVSLHIIINYADVHTSSNQGSCNMFMESYYTTRTQFSYKMNAY